MKTLIKLEEFGVLAVSVLFIYRLHMDISWWLYIILFISPDIGMLGYAASTKIGAVTYNFTHHKAVGGVLIILGVTLTNNYLLFAGLMLLAHSSFDRVMGFGLKYPDDFKHTNIGFN